MSRTALMWSAPPALGPINVQRAGIVLALIAIWSVACADSPAAPDAVVLSVEPTQQWAGGTIQVKVFGAAPTGHVTVEADGHVWETLSADGDGVTIRVPVTANGVFELVVHDEDRTLGSTSVEAFGFERAQTHPVELLKLVQPWPIAVGTAILGVFRIGSAGVEGGLALLSLSNGSTTIFPDVHYWGCRTPIISLEPGRILTCPIPEFGPAQEYALESSPRFIRELPFRIGFTFSAQLSEEIWLMGTPHDVAVLHYDGVQTTTRDIVRTEGIHGVARLPQLDLVMIETNADSGIPVFETTSGTLLFHAGENVVRGSASVTSDEGRGLFYVLGRNTDSRTRIFLVDGATGVVVDTLLYSANDLAWPQDAVVYDPARDILLINEYREARVIVVDAKTLAQIGVVEFPASYPTAAWDIEIFTDADYGYVVFTEAADGQTPVMVFRLRPIQSTR